MYANIKLHTLVGLQPVRITGLAPVTPLNMKNVAAHTNRGPDASVITDGVFAPEGHSSTTRRTQSCCRTTALTARSSLISAAP